MKKLVTPTVALSDGCVPIHVDFATIAGGKTDFIIAFALLPAQVEIDDDVRDSDAPVDAITGYPIMRLQPIVKISMPAYCIPGLIVALRDQLAVRELMLQDDDERVAEAAKVVNAMPVSETGAKIMQGILADIAAFEQQKQVKPE